MHWSQELYLLLHIPVLCKPHTAAGYHHIRFSSIASHSSAHSGQLCRCSEDCSWQRRCIRHEYPCPRTRGCLVLLSCSVDVTQHYDHRASPQPGPSILDSWSASCKSVHVEQMVPKPWVPDVSAGHILVHRRASACQARPSTTEPWTQASVSKHDIETGYGSEGLDHHPSYEVQSARYTISQQQYPDSSIWKGDSNHEMSDLHASGKTDTGRDSTTGAVTRSTWDHD